MAKVQKMFIDGLIDSYSVSTISPELIQHFPGSNKDLLFRRRFVVADLLQKAEIFVLNGAVVDDLYNLPPEDVPQEIASHLPFPVIFFEFIDALQIRRISTGEELQIKGMLFGKGIEASSLVNMLYTAEEAPDMLAVSFFYQNRRRNDMPDELFVDPGSISSLDSTEEYAAIDGEQGRDVSQEVNRGAYSKMFRLCINIIEYINAHNATVRTIERDTRNLDSINRKRRKRGKKELRPLKPYNWIDIKESRNYQGGNQTGQWSIDYRQWVRGHFQRYHTTAGIIRPWVDPYVKGPPDAPWKESRYRVLNDMFQKGPQLQDT